VKRKINNKKGAKMANKDTLISAIGQIISNYGEQQYSGYPYPDMIMQDINNIMPADITFTNQDLVEVANYCVANYPQYTYDVWYANMAQYLSSRIAAAPIIQTVIPPGTSEPFKISTNMLLIGGAILLFLFMSRGKGAQT
jgi:hypothetical protein